MTSPFRVKPFRELFSEYIDAAERTTRALSPRWRAQADVMKSLVAIISGALVLTIAFAPSLVKPQVGLFWRSCLVVCWLSLVGALVSALVCLRRSVALEDYARLIMERARDLERAHKGIDPAKGLDPAQDVAKEAFRVITHDEKVARRWFNYAFVFYGVALAALAVVGLRHLVG
jgi:hypothetical protein